MKKKYLILLSTLAALLGFQSIVSAQITVEPDEDVKNRLQYYENSASPHPEGISYKKIISQPNMQGIYNIFLEAFVTGSKVSTVKSIPSDIVLVLDVSSSMVNNSVNSYVYTADGNASRNWSYTSADNHYIEYPADSKYYHVIEREIINNIRTLSFVENGNRHYLSSEGIGGATPPTTGPTNNTGTIWTGQLYTRTTTQITRLQALKDAVGIFLNTIHNDAVKDPNNILDHKVSIVKFSGKYVGGSAETAMTPGNHSGGTNTATTEVFKGWTSMQDKTVVNTLINDVQGLKNGSGTSIDYGMNLAYMLLDRLPDIDPNNPRSKTVVVFTDGSPYRQASGDAASDTDIADAAINTSNNIKKMLAYTKQDGTNVYTNVFSVGTLGSNPSGLAMTVLEKCSSNYKDATTRNNGERVSSAYYFLAESAESLRATFASIGSTSGGATYTMDAETTATVDVISQSFMLPKNADVNSIAVWTVDCIGEYTTGDELNGLLKFSDTWDEGRAQGLQVALSDDKQTVSVTNFDYSANWCGSETNAQGLKTYRGKKLILGIPIQMATDAVGGKDLDTNTEGSGIIVNGKNILPFNVPHVSLPVVLWIRKEGLREGESARFTIYRAVRPATWPAPGSENYPKDSTDPLYNSLNWGDPVSSVFVTRHKGQAQNGINAPITKVVGLPPVDNHDDEFIYKIVEDTDWTWSYTPGTTKIFTSDQLITNPYIFSNTIKENIDITVRHAESKATNTFKNGDFVDEEGTVIKPVNASHVGYDDSKKNTGTGREGKQTE